MTKEQAFAMAQTRANFSRARVVVYLQPTFWRDQTEENRYACTKDRADLPDEWVVIGYCDPEEVKDNEPKTRA